MTSFIPHTPEERHAMLQAIGVQSVEALFSAVPESLRQDITCPHLPQEGRTELDLQQHLSAMALGNTGTHMESFLGGGAYARFIPPAVQTIASRSEFYTAYTPYQPEISQGTLQMIYEFQTMLCELTGMDVTNASVYDGAAALSEAALMALRSTRRNVLYCASSINPQYRQVLKTYLDALGDITLYTFDPHQPLATQLAVNPKQLAGVLIQQPDYYGCLQEVASLSQACHEAGALLVVSVDPMTLGLLEPPGAYGADIVCGDIQQFGNPVNYGGPYGGFIATTEKLMRQLPGRLVGRTMDKEGQTAYTLTLQTREQHIRREKATSNICTNQSLNVLKATVYLSLVGPQGLKQLATVSAQRAHYLANQLMQLPGVSMRFDSPFLYEFALQLPISAHTAITTMAQRHGILAGVDVGRYVPDEDHTLLIAVTELNSMASIQHYIDAFKATLTMHGLSTVPVRLDQRPAMMATGTFGRES